MRQISEKVISLSSLKLECYRKTTIVADQNLFDVEYKGDEKET